MTARAVPENNGAGNRGLGLWTYRTSTASNPSSGRLQFDDTTIDDATEMYINEVNANSVDMNPFLATLQPGDLIYVQIADDSTQFIVIKISTVSYAAGVFTFGLSDAEGQGSAPNQNTGVFVVISSTGGGGAAGKNTTRNMTIENPTAADNFVLFYTEVALTALQLNMVMQGATSVTVTVKFDSDRSAAGTELNTGGTLVNNTTVGQEITSFDEDAIPAGSWIWIETTALVGTPTSLSVNLVAADA